ncbi:MAG: hypothetical protein H6834_12105, partial [Planctomycetes bacterium]|nr:hypothetical protein [Planctomycetota bacterium]
QLDVRELARDPCEHAAPEPWPNAHRLGPLGMLLLVCGTGTFVQEDRGMSRPRRLELPVRRGDAIVFEVRDRLVTIGGAIGLQPVVQGFAVMEAPFVGVVFA